VQYFGLDWIGLDWIGLDWIGLDCIILYCIVTDCMCCIVLQHTVKYSNVNDEEQKGISLSDHNDDTPT
jgi:ammonia channel protein AmtB